MEDQSCMGGEWCECDYLYAAKMWKLRSKAEAVRRPWCPICFFRSWVGHGERRLGENRHHATYKHNGHELSHEIINLCRECHKDVEADKLALGRGPRGDSFDIIVVRMYMWVRIKFLNSLFGQSYHSDKYAFDNKVRNYVASSCSWRRPLSVVAERTDIMYALKWLDRAIAKGLACRNSSKKNSAQNTVTTHQPSTELSTRLVQ